MQHKIPETNTILYIYDLPKKQFTSIRLAEIIKDLTGYRLQALP